MSLKEKIRQDMVSATKSRDLVALTTLRLLLSSIKNREIEMREDADDGEVLKVIGSQIKQRKESIELFKKGGREDLAEKEGREITILELYMPPRMDREELVGLIRSVISEVGAEGIGDLGKVMKGILPKVAGRAEGREVSELAKELLSK